MANKGDQINVIVVAAKGVEAHDNLMVRFDWGANRYETDNEKLNTESHFAWMEKFEIWMHPAMEKIIRFEVRSATTDQAYGKVQIDLGLLKAGVSDAWYALSKLEGELPFKGHLRIRLNKVEDQILPPMAISAVLPVLEESVAQKVEDDYVAGLTKEEREAFYDQKNLRPAFRKFQSEEEDIVEEIPLPSGKAIPLFWELKNMFPALEDRRIYAAMHKNENDLEKTIEYLQKRQNKEAREVQKHQFIDEGRLASPPTVNEAQEAKNQAFLVGAVAGEMLDVPLFDGQGKVEGVAESNSRKALLIGCDYQKLGGKWNLEGGPLRDIRRVRNWLENVWGFANEPGRMMMMADDHPQGPCHPTAANMIRALEWLGRDAKPGDSLFVYFSGHGGTCNPTEKDNQINSNGAFEGLRPFWYGIDGGMVDVAQIYEALLFKLPDACKVTFLIDCPNFHLWQPYHFNPSDLTLRNTSHPYYLHSDVQVFTSIGHPVGRHGGRFTNTFLSLTSGANVNATYYELLHNFNKALGMEAPDRLLKLTGTKMNYYTCSQRSDLRRAFDLNSYVPNCNRQIGPGKLDIAPVENAATLVQSGAPSFKFNLQLTTQKNPDNLPPPNPVQRVVMNDPGNYGIHSPQKKSLSAPNKTESRRSSTLRDNLRAVKAEYKAAKVQGQHQKAVDASKTRK